MQVHMEKKEWFLPSPNPISFKSKLITCLALWWVEIWTGIPSFPDGLTAQGKAPCLPLRMQQPFYFPYPRFARSQSWERHVSMAATGPKYPFYQSESSSDRLSLTCKICGKSYRSRQGLLFHERAKHQNVFNVYCPVCGKGFQQTTHMYGHMATHTNVKNFQCQACGALSLIHIWRCRRGSGCRSRWSPYH